MNIIAIYRTSKGWMADFRMTENAGEVRRLFGTTVLPTGFTVAAPERMVVVALAEKNPGYSIARIHDMR